MHSSFSIDSSKASSIRNSYSEGFMYPSLGNLASIIVSTSLNKYLGSTPIIIHVSSKRILRGKPSISEISFISDTFLLNPDPDIAQNASFSVSRSVTLRFLSIVKSVSGKQCSSSINHI